MPQPHILVFLTDDHGAWAMPGPDSVIHAPSLQWLAATGTTCRLASTPNPVCSPARASFWSGLLPSAHGVHDFLHEPGMGSQHPGLQDRNLGQRLQAAGYHTMFSGKWHCGGVGARQPGFDRWASMTCGTNARFAAQTFDIDGQAVERHGHQALMVADDAIRFLREAPVAEQPCFLFVGFTDTHTPLNVAQPRLREHYKDLQLTAPHDEVFSSAHGRARFPVPVDADQQRSELIDYCAAVSSIDEQVGRVLDELRNLQILDDTLIVYTADHGHMNGQYGLMTKGNATVPQNLLDGSVHVPCIWRGPDVQASAVCDHPVDHCDMHVTLADLAGCGDWELETPTPGSSYRDVLAGKECQWRDWQVAEYGNARMWRSDSWKYIQRFPGPNGRFGDELYDLRSDPRETINCVAENRVIAAEHAALLDEHFARFGRPQQSGAEVGQQIQSAPVSPWLLDPDTLQPVTSV